MKNKDQKLHELNGLNELHGGHPEPANIEHPTSNAEHRNREEEKARTRTRTSASLEEVEPWPEPVDGAALLDALAAVPRRILVLPKWAPEALGLWSLHSYAFDLRRVSVYLGIESPEKRCGKSTLLSVLAKLAKLANRPVLAANISSPAFFRAIEELQPTLFIDEGDTFLKRRSDLRGILNAGYTRDTAYVMRVTNRKAQGGGRGPRAGVADWRASPVSVPRRWRPLGICQRRWRIAALLSGCTARRRASNATA